MKKLLILGLSILVSSLTLISCKQQTNTVTTELPAVAVTPSKKPAAFEVSAGLPQLPATTASQLQAVLNQKVAKWKIPGVQMFVATPNGYWVGASGKSSLEADIPMTVADRFRVGSVTKTFVAVVVLQLADEGKLNLDDPISKWLSPDVSRQIANSQVITIRQLLNHSSGLPDYVEKKFLEAVRANPTHPWTAAEEIQFIYGVKPKAQPGELVFYSNSNYLLLELIIQSVTGKALIEEFRQRIYQPLGLANTFMENREAIPGGFAQGYEDWDQDGKWKNLTQLGINDGLGNGDRGVVSNAAEIGKFAYSLFVQQSLISKTNFQQMFALIGDPKSEQRGLGIVSFPTPWGQSIGHSGFATGFLTEMMYLPEHNITMVVLMNQETGKKGSPYDVAKATLQTLLGAPTNPEVTR
jgi:D-alanyl-D-alanine carboxypeptidase